MVAKYADLDLDLARTLATDTEARDLLDQLYRCRNIVAPEQQRFREWCDRADRLYYAEEFSQWGADLWPEHPSAKKPGRSHVSINTPAVYVDVPAALQAVPPIENMVAIEDTEEARQSASDLERVYYAWADEDDWNLKVSKACTVKGLYGRTAGRVYWDAKKKYPCVEIVDQPRNLYLGWKTDRYDELSWTAYVQRMSPDAVIEEFGVDIEAKSLADGKIVPFVAIPGATPESTSRGWLTFGPAMIEVWDYWFLRPDGDLRFGEKTRMKVWNAVFAGNELVRYESHPEYGGKLPIVPLFNTYLPGVPDGRPDLYDLEQLIREKFERVTAGAQMIASGVAGNFWQLVGPEAPSDVPANAKPKLNQVVAPGAGNRIEAITPFIPQFQLESYLARIDREMAVVSGLNDLLLGLAPAQVLSSSKAINALIANYEARIKIRRELLYQWRKDVWALVLEVYRRKNSDVQDIVDRGGGRLDIADPSLAPRDDMETATRALNLTNGKIWSAARAMDATGVDDPEQEQNIIRGEQTDATLNPAAVQTMVQLIVALAAAQQQLPQGAQQQADTTLARGQNDLRTALAGQVPEGTNASQGEGAQGYLPPEAGTPGPGGAPPFAMPPAGPEGAGLAQTQIKGGKAESRILTQRALGRR